MGRAWRWWGVWVVVVCLMGAGRAVAECKDEAAKGRVWNPEAKGKDWTWKDADGCVRTRAEMEQILREHQLWLETDHKKGQQADFTGARLDKAYLTDARLEGADLTGARLDKAYLADAHLNGADLTRAILFGANLSGASLTVADLTHAVLVGADLTRADLGAADLSNAYLNRADLSGVFYEPKAVPSAESIAYALGLDRLRYDSNPAALVALRKSFQDAGFVQLGREGDSVAPAQ